MAADATTRFLTDLTAALVAASIFGGIARRFGITPILGYVIAGIAIGPLYAATPESTGSLGGLSELGLILLLFSLGLDFSISELGAVGSIPMIGNVLLMLLFSAAAAGLGRMFGFVHPLTFGLTFALSSTAIGVALLKIFGLAGKRPGNAAVALLVAQDLIAVLILVVTISPAAELTPAGIVLPLVKAALFVVVALVAGGTILRRVVSAFLRRAPAGAMIAFCTAVALAAAWLGHIAGLSFEFGAFIAGAVISEAAGSRMVESIVAPFREFFILVFFVSIGTFVDVRAVALHWPAIVVAGVAFALLRIAGWGLLSRLVRQPLGISVALGISLLPLGEFNVVLAKASLAAKRLDSNEYATVIGVTLLTILFAAVLTRISASRLGSLDAASLTRVAPFEGAPNVLILGYGRVGRTVGSICKRAGISFAVIETDVDLVELARRDGAHAQYGDGGDPQIVEHAMVPSVRAVLSTIPDSAANVALARRLSHQTDVRIVARARRMRDVDSLRAAGAHDVLVPEAEGAYRFAETVLSELGISQERVAAVVLAERSRLS
ncbi:MAG TPA: cation:proton antiporter [Candidatus Cybelea sp.]|jgi:CPA2 family monovalent cation:H+ antiporter-2|nr:cation:proton antiporter [Candidatus Cybelea sp.]